MRERAQFNVELSVFSMELETFLVVRTVWNHFGVRRYQLIPIKQVKKVESNHLILNHLLARFVTFPTAYCALYPCNIACYQPRRANCSIAVIAQIVGFRSSYYLSCKELLLTIGYGCRWHLIYEIYFFLSNSTNSHQTLQQPNCRQYDF